MLFGSSWENPNEIKVRGFKNKSHSSWGKPEFGERFWFKKPKTLEIIKFQI